jgi:hypothetical protein
MCPCLLTISPWAAAQVIKDGTSRLIVTKPPKAHGNRRTLERAAREYSSGVVYARRRVLGVERRGAHFLLRRTLAIMPFLSNG